MKHVFQIAAFSFFSLDAMQIILVISVAVMFYIMAINKFSGRIKVCEARKAKREFEMNMWAIE